MVRLGRFGNALARAELAGVAPPEARAAAHPANAPETAKEARRREDRSCLGGLRAPRYAVRRLPGYQRAGALVRSAILAHMRALPDQGNLVAAFGSKELGNRATEKGQAFAESVEVLSRELCRVLGAPEASAAGAEYCIWHAGLARA